MAEHGYRTAHASVPWPCTVRARDDTHAQLHCTVLNRGVHEVTLTACCMPGRLVANRAGHTVQFVAALDCTGPRAMFVLHCLLHNIAGDVEAQLTAVAAMLAASTVDSHAQARLRMISVITDNTRSSRSDNSSKQSEASNDDTTNETGGGEPRKRRRTGTGDKGKSKGRGRAGGWHRGAGDWTLDDAPDAVRKCVAEADERQLRLVPGLSAVRRVPEPVRELLHDDGILIGCSKVRGGSCVAWQMQG